MMNLPMFAEHATAIAYLIACCLMIIGIKQLNKSNTARRGTFLAALGTFIGVAAAFFDADVVQSSYDAESVFHNGYFWVFLAVAIGSAIGAICSKAVRSTGMFKLVTLYSGFGGLATAFIAFSEFSNFTFIDVSERAVYATDPIFALFVSLAIFLGVMTFTGSILAWGKLYEKTTERTRSGLYLLNTLLVSLTVASLVIFVVPNSDPTSRFYALLALPAIAFILGFTFVSAFSKGNTAVAVPLLNSLTGIAVAMVGFMLVNMLLIVAGALVATSGIAITTVWYASNKKP